MSKVICIDPGHGGKDPGGGSNNSFKEKDKVLDISFEQKKHFERNGIKVVMTRTTDTYLDSVPRTNKVKNSGAGHCISNHINAGGGEGAETIHSIHSNGKVAEGILKSLVALGAKYRRFFSKKNSSGSDWYFMHRLTGNVSTIIVEYGFADNTSDTNKIIKNWKKYAEAVARYYIENVFNQKYVPASGGGGGSSKPKPKPSKPDDKDFVWVGTNKKGRRVESIYKGSDGLNFYDGPRWSNPSGTFGYGEGWIVDNLYRVNGSLMYRVQNSKGDLYWITAASKYVQVK